MAFYFTINWTLIETLSKWNLIDIRQIDSESSDIAKH